MPAGPANFRPRSARKWSSPRSRGFSDRAPRTPTSTSRGTGPPRSGAEDATADASVPVSGRATARRCGSPWAGSTGRARRRRRCGTATWTERCAPARGPPAKCSPPEDRRTREAHKDLRTVEEDATQAGDGLQEPRQEPALPTADVDDRADARQVAHGAEGLGAERSPWA